MTFIRNAVRTCAAAYNRSAGVLWFHCRAYHRARQSFQRVLELTGDDFTSYVYLGRLAYSCGDYAGWRRECELARQASPSRFEKLDHPFVLHRPRGASRPYDTLNDSVFESASERASWRSWSGSPQSPDGGGSSMPSGPRIHGSWSHLPQPQSTAHRSQPAPDAARDDFSSELERSRFRSLDALRAADIADVDFDALSRKLG